MGIFSFSSLSTRASHFPLSFCFKLSMQKLSSSSFQRLSLGFPSVFLILSLLCLFRIISSLLLAVDRHSLNLILFFHSYPPRRPTSSNVSHTPTTHTATSSPSPPLWRRNLPVPTPPRLGPHLQHPHLLPLHLHYLHGRLPGLSPRRRTHRKRLQHALRDLQKRRLRERDTCGV